MKRWLSALLVGTLLQAAVPAGQRTGAPMRIVLLVDSSTAVAGMITQFRAGLNLLVDILPDDVEVAFISMGGQLRVRLPPTTDHAQLRKAVSSFTADGGGNAFLDSMIESDNRFLKTVPDFRPVFIILTTDAGFGSQEPRLDQYNRFMKEFTQRRGRAHAIVIHGPRFGATTLMASNLAENTGGYFESVGLATAVAGRMKELGVQLNADY